MIRPIRLSSLLENESLITKTMSLVLITAGLVYLFSKSVLLNYDTIDFKYIWLAGRIWVDGGNPYTSLFNQLGVDLFVGTNRPTIWVYPPHWWLIAVPMASLDYQEAGALWRNLSGLCILSGCVVVSYAYMNLTSSLNIFRFSFFVTYVCVMSATAISLSLGQTSPFLFLGISVFLAGFLLDRQWLVVIALAILMLKPNVGAVFAAFLLAFPRWIPTLFVGAALVLICMIPAFWTAGIQETLSGYISELSRYTSISLNFPNSMTGVRNLLYAVLAVDFSPALMVLFAFSITFILVRLLPHGWRIESSNIDQRLLLASLPLVSLVSLIPLHNYDSLYCAPLLLLSARLRLANQALLLLAMLILLRANNLALFTGFFDPNATYAPGVLISSIVFVSILLGFLFLLWQARSSEV